MKPSEQIHRLERDLKLARQEAMDLRVALKECAGALSECYDVCDYPANGRTAQDDAIRTALVALGTQASGSGGPTP